MNMQSIYQRLKLIRQQPAIAAIEAALPEQTELYLVGGTLRDIILDRTIYDFDLASSMEALPLCEHLEQRGIRTIPTGLKHNTVTALPRRTDRPVEITTFRGKREQTEAQPAQGITEDLWLRDFTINALAYNLITEELIDPVQGLLDIQHKIVRAVGSPAERFKEDPLRLLRMVRFASWEGFSLDQESRKEALLKAPLLARISVERIREEFNRILLSERPKHGLFLLLELKLLEQFMPEVAAFDGFEQNRFHHLDLFSHCASVVEKTPPDLVLRLAALLHDIGKPSTLSTDEQGERHFFCHETVGLELARAILERLRYSRNIISDVEVLIRTHMRPLTAGPSGLRRLLRDTDHLFEKWRQLKKADSLSVPMDPQVVEREFADFDKAIAEVHLGPDVSPFKNLAVNGNDLIALGLKPGPSFGTILRTLHEKVLDKPELNSKEVLLKMVQEMKIVELKN